MKKEELLHEMEASINQLIHEAEHLSEEEFESMHMTGTWTAKEILSHVAAWDLVFMDVSRKLLEGRPPKSLPDFDTFNAREVSKRSSLTRDEIIHEVRQNRKTYEEFLAGLTPEQLFGSTYMFTIGGLAEEIMSHDRHHLQQIRVQKKE
jgi:uncharacterized damage-inducible protein DinB